MFKRPRLSTRNSLVNASPALALLFLAVSCSQSNDTVERDPQVTPETVAPQGLVLPAVWQSEDLGAPLNSVAVAGELGSTVAVTFEDGGLQFLNFEGDRITQKADLGVSQVADGRYTLLSGTPVTLFPGISERGDITLYIHGGELPEPLAYPLDVGTDEYALGLCTAAPKIESDGVVRLGFWTEGDKRKLRSGRIVQVADELVFLPDEPVTTNVDITACVLEDTGATVFSAPAIASARLERRNFTYTMTLDSSGGYLLTDTEGGVTPFTVSDGITVRVPPLPVDIAGTGDARGGGYSAGVVVIAGESSGDKHAVTYIDPSIVTLKPFGYQADQ